MPLYIPSINTSLPIPHEITMRYLQQYATMVDLLLHREISKNGWSIHATLISTSGNDRVNHYNNSNQEYNESTNDLVTQKSDFKDDVKEMPLWIHQGRIFKKV